MFVSRALKKAFFNSSLRTFKKAFSTKPEEQSMFINSQKINYMRVGDGPKKIFLFPSSLGTMWSDFQPQIMGLDRNKFTIIAWDPPGIGKSRPPNKKFNPEMHEDNADMAYEFMKILGEKYFSVLGWSDGAVSSLILAAKYPHVIEKIVVWGGSSYVVSKDVEEIENIRDINKFSERIRRALIDIHGEEELQRLHHLNCDWMIKKIKDGGDICNSLLKDIQCPTLITHGDKDPLVDPVHPENLKKNIKGSRLHRFPHGKHNLHLRYAEEFNNIVTDFILNDSKF